MDERKSFNVIEMISNGVIIIKKRLGQSDVDAYLSKVRIAIDEKRCNFDSRKPKNKATLSGLGITIEEAYDEVKSLTYEDYWYGPEPDNRPGKENLEVWFFKKAVFWKTIYIKLEFVMIGVEKLIVMSFHEDNVK